MVLVRVRVAPLGQRGDRVDQGPAPAQKEYQEADLPF
jgi:uncharacterized protein YqgV (UPF0045/DUF77 family)